MKTRTYLKLLLSSTAIVALGASPSFAQDDSSAPSVNDEVVVTGSRIKKSTFSSPVSMDVLNADAAKIEGIADIGGLLQTATAASGSNQITAAVSTAYVANGGVGAETIGLRGLGANRTLDLVNGRRAGPSGTRGSIDAFDLGSIPLLGVEQVDILKDGASAIYGSDAIAGVVNYITDKSDGAEIDLYTQIAEEGSGEIFRGSATYGDSFERGRFRVTADYYKREELARKDRSYLDCTQNYTFTDASLSTRADVIDPRTGNPQCGGTIWGQVWVYDYGSDNLAPNPRNIILQFDRGGNLGNFIPSVPATQDGSGIGTPPGWFQVEYFPDDIAGNPLFAGFDATSNFQNAVTDLYPEMQSRDSVVPELERMTLMGDVEYELTDNITAYGEALFNRRETYVNGHKQYWTYQYGESAAVFGGGANTNPISAGWTGDNTWFSPTPVVEHGDEEVKIDYWRLVGGLRGSFGESGPFPGWDWDVYAQHSNSSGEYTEQIIRNDAIAPYNFQTSSCVGQTSPGATATTNTGETVTIAGRPCVDLPWFSPDFLAGDLSQAERDFLLDSDTGTTDFTQTTIEGYVTGDVIDMPGGKLQAALGYFFQRDEITDRPSDTTLAGNEFQGSQAGITTGVQSTNAIYGEVSIPLVRDYPLFENLELIGSGRYTEITSENRDGRSISVDGFNYRATANWQIIPALRLRGTIGTSFRAPALYEQFLADESSSLRQSAIDPCIGWANALTGGDITQQIADNCAVAGIPSDYAGAPIAASILTGGGFGVLEPETSQNYTAGFVLRPSFADLSLSVDYFDITIKGEIGTLSAGAIVQGCYDSVDFPNDPLCGFFDRGVDNTGDFRIDTINVAFINISEQSNRGIDATLNYTTETPWGNFNLNSQVTHQLESQRQLLTESSTEFFNGGFGEPEWTGLANMTLTPSDNLLLRWGVDYIGKTNGLRTRFDQTADLSGQLDANGGYTLSQDGTTVFNKYETEAMFYHSLSAQYKYDGGWTLRAGVNNVFDEHPPAVSNVTTGVVRNGNSPIVSQYDLLGRRFFFNISKKFN